MSNLIGKSLGRYHILEQLGEGGMATVYKAYDTRLETDVAVKVIRTENILPSVLERSLKRFEREAKSLARLTHPNIVKVTDYGEFEGKPYLVMPYLPGGTLKDRIKQGQIPWQEAVRLILPIAQALEYAHEHNIIHRDVKPSNILLTEKGQPMLTDFGVAKLFDMDATADLTGTGMGVGTPEYMAPEQWHGQVSVQTDVYALGVVLFEMVTGRKPYVADTPAALMLKQATEPLPRPKNFVPGLPDEVEKVLLKALAKSREDRYQGVSVFIEGLANLSMNKSRDQQTFSKPKFGEVGNAGTYTRDKFLQRKTFTEEFKASGSDEYLRKSPMIQSIWTSTISKRFRVTKLPLLIAMTGLGGFAILLLIVVTISSRRPNFDIESLKASGALHQLEHNAEISDVAVSPDHTLMVSSSGTSVYLWSVPDGNNLGVWETSMIIKDVDLSPNGEYLAVQADTSLQIWHFSDQVLLYTFQSTGEIKDFSFSPDGKFLGLTDGKTVQIYDVSNGSGRYTITPSDTIDSFSFSSNSVFLETAGDNILQLWRTSDGTLWSTAQADPGSEFSSFGLRFSGDNSSIVIPSYILSPAEGWNLENIQLRRTLDGSLINIFPAQNIGFSPDGSIFALVSKSGGTVELRGASDGVLVSAIRLAGNQSASDIAISPDDKLVALTVIDKDGHLKGDQIWQISDGQLLQNFDKRLSVAALRFVDNTTLESVCITGTQGLDDSQFCLWSATDPQWFKSLPTDPFIPNKGSLGQSFSNREFWWRYFYSGNTLYIWKIEK